MNGHKASPPSLHNEQEVGKPFSPPFPLSLSQPASDLVLQSDSSFVFSPKERERERATKSFVPFTAVLYCPYFFLPFLRLRPLLASSFATSGSKKTWSFVETGVELELLPHAQLFR